MPINSVRLGIFLGLFLAIVHAAWAILVAVGWAQPLMNFVFWAHFITPPYHIEPFDPARAAVLVIFVFVMGLALGTGGGVIWNRLASTD